MGLVGGGSDTVGRAVLAHFGLSPRDAAWVHVPHDEAIGMLHRGEIDAMCVLAALPAPAVGRALASPEVELVGMGDVSLRGSSLDGVRYDVPFARGAVVPEREYGARPERAVGTVGVPVLLVAHERVDAVVVTAVAAALFAHRHDLARHDPLLARVTERFDPAATGFALHPGVVAWLHRGDAPSLVRWADTMSLALTVAVLVFSATRELARRRREARHERIDAYVLEVLARCEKVPTGEAERAAWRDGLHALQRQVCDEVLSGRLRADDAFTAFQGLVDEALAEADASTR